MAAPQPVLDLNLATRPFRNNSLLWLGFGAAVVALLLLTGWNVQTYRDYSTRLRDLRAEVASYQSRMDDLTQRNERAKAGIRGHDLETLGVRSDKANDIIGLKAFSWTTLFNRLEEILPYNVRMQRIRPIFRIGRDARRESLESDERAVPVQVEGRAQEFGAFLDLQGALLASPYFDQVDPDRYDKVDNEIEFALRFQYYPNREEDAETVDPEPAESGDPVEGVEQDASTEDAPGQGEPEREVPGAPGEASDGADLARGDESNTGGPG